MSVGNNWKLTGNRSSELNGMRQKQGRDDQHKATGLQQKQQLDRAKAQPTASKPDASQTPAPKPGQEVPQPHQASRGETQHEGARHGGDRFATVKNPGEKLAHVLSTKKVPGAGEGKGEQLAADAVVGKPKGERPDFQKQSPQQGGQGPFSRSQNLPKGASLFANLVRGTKAHELTKSKPATPKSPVKTKQPTTEDAAATAKDSKAKEAVAQKTDGGQQAQAAVAAGTGAAKAATVEPTAARGTKTKESPKSEEIGEGKNKKGGAASFALGKSPAQTNADGLNTLLGGGAGGDAQGGGSSETIATTNPFAAEPLPEVAHGFSVFGGEQTEEEKLQGRLKGKHQLFTNGVIEKLPQYAKLEAQVDYEIQALSERILRLPDSGPELRRMIEEGFFKNIYGGMSA